MSLIKVTWQELETLSRNVQSGSEQIGNESQKMSSEVESLVNGGWQGGASSQFHSLWTEWHRSAASLNEALEGIARLLQEAGHQYEMTEENIKAAMA